MKATDVFSLLGEIPPNIGPLYQAKLRTQMDAVGITPQTPQYYVLAVTHDYDPQPASVATFAVRDPYSNPVTYAESFEALVENGLLAPAEGEGYTLTDAGRAAMDTLQALIVAELGRLEPLPAGDLERIKLLLGRLVEGALAAPEPSDKPLLRVNRNSDPGEAGPLLLNLLQYQADLNAFRDEVHLAAWRPYGVSGPAWEALTFVWRDEAHSAGELAEKLPNRRYGADAYAAALDELAARGWIEQTGEQVRLTEAGTAARQQVEDDTDRMYFAAWSALSADEITELGGLLQRLRDALQALNAARQPETADA